MRNSYSKKISLKSRLLTLVSFISIILLIPQKSQAKNFAPDLKVTGKVTDEKSSPLSNVSVVVKGTSKGVTSDLNGNFSIAVPDNNAVLVISYVGYKTKEVPVGSQTNLSIALVASSEQLTDVVVVGYGTQKKVTV